MGEVELTKFTGGLVLKPTDDDLQISQVQQAENVDFVREPGAVQPRRGINKWSSKLFSTGNNDVFFQNTLDTVGLLVKSGTTLYDKETPVGWGYATDRMRFTEFAKWVILVDGTRSQKYKDTGSVLHWNVACSAGHELAHAALISLDQSHHGVSEMVPFVWKTGDYYCCFDWETYSDYLTGAVSTLEWFLTSNVEDFYTSSGKRLRVPTV